MTMEDSDSQEKTKEEKIYYYRLAGKINYEVHEAMKPLIVENASILEICTKAEDLIFEKGGKLAFPCNVSINEIAAHYTSPLNDESVIPPNSVVKLDLGVHIEGFIADKAVTISLNPEYDNLVKASEASFQAGIEICNTGVETTMIGAAIEEKTKEFGFIPIRELSGHLLDEYQLHGKKSIPNVALPFNKAGSVLEDGEAYALETFATTGSGSVHEMKNKFYIFSLLPTRVPLRSRESRAIRNFIVYEYQTLPFSGRRLYQNEKFHRARVSFALKEMINHGGLIKYGVLADEKESFVSQYENTFLVTPDGPEITSLPPFDIKMPDSLKEKEEKAEEAEDIKKD